MILDQAFLAKLDRLALVARRVRPGQSAGERRSTKRGSSVEFADYRNYTRGDDPRHVDWNVYARLERPYVKLFEEEEDLAVHVLLDGSDSMAWGEEAPAGEDGEPAGESLEKWGYARRLAAALGYVALACGDRLTVTTLRSQAGGPGALPGYGPSRGRHQALRMLQWLETQETAGTTDLNASLRAYAIAGGRAGLVVLVSDLFSPRGHLEGLTQLAARGHELAILHVLSPDEVDPPLGGDLRLVDVETGEAQEVSIDGAMRTLYRRRLAEWRDEIRVACRARDVHYVPVVTDQPLDHVVLHDLRRAGLVV